MIAAACCAFAAAAIIAPTTASAVPVHVHHTEIIGHQAWHFVTVEHRAPLDGDEDGFANTKDDCPKTPGPDAGCPLPEPAAPTTTTTYKPPTYSAGYSSGGCPSYMAGEATSPDAVNPTSGASGCYQVLPSTAALMGAACADVNAPSCVAAICAAQGNGAWASSGATPC
jgi:hypothetical protein